MFLHVAPGVTCVVLAFVVHCSLCSHSMPYGYYNPSWKLYLLPLNKCWGYQFCQLPFWLQWEHYTQLFCWPLMGQSFN